MTTPTKHYLKFLKHDRMPTHGVGQWPEPGVWTPTAEPIPCKQGWHLCRKQDLFLWFSETLWVVEAETEGLVIADDKVVARRARLVRQVEEWNDRNLRLFAADCAEHVLKNYEAKHPNDDRPRKAIETARRFARGEATVQELGAARSAAWSAAKAAALSAARSAARSAAWSAAESAAGAAAWAAAREAAEAAASAIAIAWSAAESARFAADAGRNAERAWQIEHLFKEYLKLDPNDFH